MLQLFGVCYGYDFLSTSSCVLLLPFLCRPGGNLVLDRLFSRHAGLFKESVENVCSGASIHLYRHIRQLHGHTWTCLHHEHIRRIMTLTGNATWQPQAQTYLAITINPGTVVVNRSCSESVSYLQGNFLNSAFLWWFQAQHLKSHQKGHGHFVRYLHHS